jgi:hypothetical protein
MSGNDIDRMYVLLDVRVYEDINKVPFNSTEETPFAMDMDDCNLGFTHLRLVQCNHHHSLQCCKQIGNDYYLSNELLKTYLISNSQRHGNPYHVHGPCLSDKNNVVDHAICFHSRQWISPAYKWVTRHNTSWPSSELKSNIIVNGVIFFVHII